MEYEYSQTRLPVSYIQKTPAEISQPVTKYMPINGAINCSRKRHSKKPNFISNINYPKVRTYFFHLDRFPVWRMPSLLRELRYLPRIPPACHPFLTSLVRSEERTRAAWQVPCTSVWYWRSACLPSARRSPAPDSRMLCRRSWLRCCSPFSGSSGQRLSSERLKNKGQRRSKWNGVGGERSNDQTKIKVTWRSVAAQICSWPKSERQLISPSSGLRCRAVAPIWTHYATRNRTLVSL